MTESVRAAEYYCGRLGFTPLFAYRPSGPDPCYMGIHRDGVELHLSSFSGDGVSGGVVYIQVDDVDALHRVFLSRGVPIAMEPTDQTWGNREMYVRDPDGNSLRFIRHGARQ